jgi:serine/threonine protein kinase
MTESPVSSSPDLGALFERSEDVIGRGAFSIVYRGRNKLTCAPVAIKVFTDTNESRFRHTIQCFDQIGSHAHSSSALMSEVSSMNGGEQMSMKNESVRSIAAASYRPSKDISRLLRLALVGRDLIVSLLDYSRTSDGKPGQENGEFFIVMEMADMSLEDYIDARQRAKQPFSVEEVKSILHDVARMVCLLHANGLAHLDVKPANIMLFQSTSWKLIDFDGCFSASSLVDVVESDIAFTPLYCAPEIAKVIVKMTDKLKVSRFMDVWSVGAIAAELVLMRPVFEHRFNQLYDKKRQDDTQFLEWLAGPLVQVESEQLEAFDPQLAALVLGRMLVADLGKRASLPDVLRHPFFSHFRPNKRSWALQDTAARSRTEASITTRILPIQRDNFDLNATNQVDSDEVAALVEDDSFADEGHHEGLEFTPMMSPGSMRNSKRAYRFICCTIDEKTS